MKGFNYMNTLFIKIFFSFVSIIIFEYVLSFIGFEIKKNGNILGAIFLGLFCVVSVICSNIVFWTN